MWPCKDSSVSGTERIPLFTLSGKTESPLSELPGPGPQGECQPLDRDKNWLKLSFCPPKCQLDLWREWAGPLGAWLPLELHHRCSEGRDIAGREGVPECSAGELLFAFPPCLAVLLINGIICLCSYSDFLHKWEKSGMDISCLPVCSMHLETVLAWPHWSELTHSWTEEFTHQIC